MGNANIDPALKKEIEKLFQMTEFRVRYQNVKGFINNACATELKKWKKLRAEDL